MQQRSALSYIPFNVLIPIIIIIAVAIAVTRILSKFLNEYFIGIATRTKVSITKYHTLSRLIIAAVWLLAVIMMISTVPFIQNLWITIFASAGIIGIVIGMGTQSTVSNLIAGVTIAISEPFSIGETITVSGYSGALTDITFRNIILKTVDGNRVIVPNSIVASSAVLVLAPPKEQTEEDLDTTINYDWWNDN